MKARFLFPLVALTFLAIKPRADAQGTAFNYTGQLYDSGSPANGVYDLRVSLFNSDVGGLIAWGPLTNSGVAVSNGLVALTLDYGDVFGGAAYWLQIEVRSNGVGPFTVLSPRQELRPEPYAIFAEGANAAGLSGAIPSASLAGGYGSAVDFTNPANVFLGDGSGLSGVNAATLGGAAAASFWMTAGNSGTSPSNGNFVGTTDNQPLELRVNGSRALRLEPIANASNVSNMVNVIGGSPINAVTPGYVGATIAGGGSSLYIFPGILPNSVAADFGSIGGGAANTVNATGGIIAGGRGNYAGGFGFPTVSGGESNSVAGSYATVAGGTENTADGNYSTVGGGFTNAASVEYATVGGGAGNSAGGNYATVGGGHGNITLDVDATVGGGYYNSATNSDATVAGGSRNAAGGSYATVAGGASNFAEGNYATVGGGENNIAGIDHGTVGGGSGNAAANSFATVAGGRGNNASGASAMVPGGYGNTAEGARSFAAGSYAWAEYDGSFVWADDSSEHLFIDLAANVFFARCTGGVKFTTATDSFGADAAGVKVGPGGTSWSSVCDRDAKKNFQPVDLVAVLNKLAAIPLQQWNYKWEADAATPHLGPMAQDFKAAFYPGRDDKSISTLEFDGVELAAIQGLNRKLEDRTQSLEQKLQQKEAEIQRLRQTVDELKQAVEQWAAKKGE